MEEQEQPANKPKNKRSKLTPEMEAAKWQPGQSGNPSGRPKKKPITELYEQILNDPEQVDMLRNAILKSLKGGNMAMVLQLKEITDRVEGKVTQPIEADVTVTNLAETIAAARKRAGR